MALNVANPNAQDQFVDVVQGPDKSSTGSHSTKSDSGSHSSKPSSDSHKSKIRLKSLQVKFQLKVLQLKFQFKVLLKLVKIYQSSHHHIHPQHNWPLLIL